MALDIAKTLITALLLTPSSAMANTVHRCVDTTGHITFTTLSCPPGQQLYLQDAYNPKPGSLAPPTPMISPSTARIEKELVVVGQRDDGCANILSPARRRMAIINYETPAGMTKADVERLLGKPDQIAGRNGETRWVYKEKKGRSRQVTFDENGCVKGQR